MVDCSIETVAVLGRQALYAHFKESYGVLLRFYPGIDGVSCQVNLRGSYEAVQRLKEAVHHFCRIARTFAVSRFSSSTHLIRCLFQNLHSYSEGFCGDEVGDVFRPRVAT